MKKALARLKCVLFKADPDFVELWCGCLTLAFGGFLLLPYKTFGKVGVYGSLSALMSEESWGIVFVIVGALKIYVYLQGTYSHRRYCLFVMACLWSLVTSFILVAWDSHIYSAAPLIFIFITIAIVWAFLRVGVMKNIRENLYGNGG